MSEITWADGIPSAPVSLEEFRNHWRLGRDTAFQLIRDGVLPAHRKTPGKKGSPYVISPAEARKYARNVGAAA